MSGATSVTPTLHGLRHRVREASGAYGVVYRASSPTREEGSKQPRRRYAVKRLLVSKNTSFCSSIRELDLVMNCQHPYVVQCYGLASLDTIFHGGRPSSTSSRYKDDDSVQVYMYYDTTLAAVKLEPQDVTILILRLLAALEYIHGRGIVHRDLKPSNIMIDQYMRPRIGDFGQAQRVALITSDVGQTLRYRSPELLSRRPVKTYDPRASDIWALGCIMHELLHGGKSPFAVANAGAHNITEEALLACIVETLEPSVRVEDDASPDQGLKEITKQMLTMDPRSRPTAAELIANPLFSTHPLESAVQRVRIACPPFPSSLDTVIVDEKSLLRRRIGKHLRDLARLDCCSIVSLFHVVELVDRLSSDSLGDARYAEITLSCLYIMHKYLCEDHVTEALSFEGYSTQLREVITTGGRSTSWWSNLERQVLQSLNFIVYRTTPYEYRVGLSGSPPTKEELTRLLIAYTHLPSGRYHVGDIVTAATHLPLKVECHEIS